MSRVMDDNDLNEFGIFVCGDGIRESVPWKLDSSGNGALLPAQIADLAGRFGFSPSDLNKLSHSIGRSLNPSERLHIVPALPRSVAASRAGKEIERSLADVAAAFDKVVDARERLELLHTNDFDAREGVVLLAQVRNRLQQCADELDALEDDLHALAKSGDCVLVLAPADRRCIVDQRRRWVLTDIFQFWHDSGSKGKYTSDPFTSERSGPLIEFTNAVVASVTDPPSPLSGDTIVWELRSFKPLTKEIYEAIEAAFRPRRGVVDGEVE
jgi:hypothetical protein